MFFPFEKKKCCFIVAEFASSAYDMETNYNIFRIVECMRNTRGCVSG